jgi:hypothetical protein
MYAEMESGKQCTVKKNTWAREITSAMLDQQYCHRPALCMYCTTRKHSHWPNRSASTHLFPGALGQTWLQLWRPNKKVLNNGTSETALRNGTSTLAHESPTETSARDTQFSETQNRTHYVIINSVITLRRHHNLPDETDALVLTQQFSTFWCSRNGMNN